MAVKFTRRDNLDKMLDDLVIVPKEKSDKEKKDDELLAKAMATFDAKEAEKKDDSEKKSDSADKK